MSENSPQPIFLLPDRGELLDYGDGDFSTVKASGAATGGAFSIVEHRLAPHAEGPPRHRHKQLCDAFYVLEGTLTLWLDSEVVEAPAGSFACFPPGAVHTFANRGETPVRVLNINAPGGWDNVLRNLVAAAQSQTVGSTEVGHIAAQYDMEVVE